MNHYLTNIELAKSSLHYAKAFMCADNLDTDTIREAVNLILPDAQKRLFETYYRSDILAKDETLDYTSRTEYRKIATTCSECILKIDVIFLELSESEDNAGD